MNFLNLGLPEVIFIIILAVIIFGPNNMVKSAKEAGALLRKMTQSPYWQEVWATKKELDELPKMLAKEANLDETFRDFNNQVKTASGSTKTMVSELMKEVNQPEPGDEVVIEKINSILPDSQESSSENKKEILDN